jgi:hypothetical protein
VNVRGETRRCSVPAKGEVLDSDWGPRPPWRRDAEEY